MTALQCARRGRAGPVRAAPSAPAAVSFEPEQPAEPGEREPAGDGERDVAALDHPGRERRERAEEAGAADQQRVAADAGADEQPERERPAEVRGQDALGAPARAEPVARERAERADERHRAPRPSRELPPELRRRQPGGDAHAHVERGERRRARPRRAGTSRPGRSRTWSARRRSRCRPAAASDRRRRPSPRITVPTRLTISVAHGHDPGVTGQRVGHARAGERPGGAAQHDRDRGLHAQQRTGLTRPLRG